MRKKGLEEVELYKRIRKRMPPPGKVLPDRRRKIEKEEAEKELASASEPEKVRAHVFIEGRVQGVFFRSYTADEAGRNNVTGWVRNLSDGRVEAVFEGEKPAVRKMVDWCRQGPPGAHVTNVSVSWAAATGEFSGFSARETAWER